MPALKFLSLGGAGKVTQNMYLYEYEDEMLLVDCGIGFPDVYMPGVDILIPDISYLLQRIEEGARIVGLIFSHGHDDHIAATPYVLPNLPDFPMYGSALTAAFAEQRIGDAKLQHSVQVVKDRTPAKVSQHFSFEFLSVTHSVPDTKHIVITTPEGIIYHGTDFKLDPTPVDNRTTDLERITQLGNENVLCMLVDCLRIERPAWSKSESTTGPAIEQTMVNTRGKFVITLMSSHIHRIQQVVDAATRHNRKVAFIGRSVEQNVKNAVELNMLSIPKGMLIDKRNIDDFPPEKVCLIVAGAQGQEGSSLLRAIYGEHPILQLKQEDKVVFSADAIPGNELNYFGAIDELCRNNIDVVYPDILPDLHQSGHASEPEQMELIGLLKPKYVMPIGGQDRHRRLFKTRVAEKLDYKEKEILTPEDGAIVGFEDGGYKVLDVLSLRPQIVDGLGIGDVGPVVLSDRRALGQAGIVAIVIPRIQGEFDLSNIDVVSKGFVFMRDAAEVVDFIKQETAKALTDPKIPDDDEGKHRHLERRISRRLYKIIRREPVIVSVFMDV